jgi:hypothetical protein
VCSWFSPVLPSQRTLCSSSGGVALIWVDIRSQLLMRLQSRRRRSVIRLQSMRSMLSTYQVQKGVEPKCFPTVPACELDAVRIGPLLQPGKRLLSSTMQLRICK